MVETKTMEKLFHDFTVEDFLKQSREDKLETILTTVNHPVRMVTIWSLKEGKVYSNGKEILDDVLDTIGIPGSEFERNKKEYGNLLPKGSRAYWSYVDDTREGHGVLTKYNLVTRLNIKGKVGYKLTSFGKEVKYKVIPKFVELFEKYDVSPDALGSVVSQKSVKYTVKLKDTDLDELSKKVKNSTAMRILQVLMDKKNLTLEELQKYTNLGKTSLRSYIKELSEEGVVEIVKEETKTRAPLNAYKILTFMYDCHEKGKEYVTQKELEKIGISGSTVSHHIKRLVQEGIVEERTLDKQVYKLKRFPSSEDLKKIRFKNEYIFYVVEKAKEKGSITLDDLAGLPLNEGSKIDLLFNLCSVGVLERATGLKFREKQTAYRLTNKGVEFVRDLTQLVEKVLSGEIFEEEPKYLSSEVVLEFLKKFYSPKKEKYGKRRKTTLETVYMFPNISLEDLHKITGINKETIAWHLTDLSRKGLVRRLNRKYYPGVEAYNLYKMICSVPGVNVNSFDEKERSWIKLLSSYGAVVDVNGYLYARKWLKVVEKDGEKEITTYYRFTDKAYAEMEKPELIKMKEFLLSPNPCKEIKYLSEKARKALNYLLKQGYIEPIA